MATDVGEGHDEEVWVCDFCGSPFGTGADADECEAADVVVLPDEMTHFTGDRPTNALATIAKGVRYSEDPK